MLNSESPLIASLFPDRDASSSEPGKEGARRTRTVFASFRASLRALSTTLETTSARYIRCVKPNATKLQRQFDGRYIAQQLQCTGAPEPAASTPPHRARPRGSRLHARGRAEPPHLHTSTPPHLRTSTPPHLHTSTPPHLRTGIRAATALQLHG